MRNHFNENDIKSTSAFTKLNFFSHKKSEFDHLKVYNFFYLKAICLNI